MTNALGFPLPVRAAVLGLALLVLPWSTATAGAIAGTIRDAETGEVLKNIDLDVFDASFGYAYGFDDPGSPNNDVTAADGTYLLEPLAVGTYYLRADPSITQGYVMQYHADSFLPSGATLVHVRATGNTEVDFYLTRGHRISGQVVDAETQAPLPGVDLDVFATDGTFVDWINADTDANGNFSLALFPNGAFHVRADPPPGSPYMSQYVGGALSIDASQAVTVANGDVTGIVIALDKGGTVSGIVSARDTGAPLAGVDMDLFDGDGKFLSWANADTDANGAFIVGSLPPGNYYVLADASPAQGYVDTYYGDGLNLAAATAIAIAPGTIAANTDISMPRGGTIGGKVTNGATGAPLNLVALHLFDANNVRVATAQTASDGTYLIGAVLEGGYKLRCMGVANLGLAFQYHTGSIVASQSPAIPVLAGTSVPDIDFALQQGGWIIGTVKLKTGEPLVDVDMDLFDLASGEHVSTLDADTDATGQYLFGPIPVGTFAVEANPTKYAAYRERFYGGADLSTATPLEVTAGTIMPGIDFLYGGLERVVRRRHVEELSAYPNPFNPRTRIAFDLEASGPVKVTIHDVRGRVLAVLADRVLSAGRHEFLWDGRGVEGTDTSSGVHFVRVESSRGVDRHKLILLK